ncbi:MAG TPA: hydrogenase maturation protease [Geobacteraceae bacterium]|nr:hydrogenase maturation protease [Geobacteraceae bacterium]
MKSVIIGMGNPLLKDDGVGIRTVRAMAPLVTGRADVELLELYTGGIRLMEAMAGYDRALVVDAMVTGGHEPGTVSEFSPDEFITTRHTFSTHDTDFRTSEEMGRLLGLHLPSEIKFWGVEAADVETFGEELSAKVAAAVPGIVEQLLMNLT